MVSPYPFIKQDQKTCLR